LLEACRVGHLDFGDDVGGRLVPLRFELANRAATEREARQKRQRELGRLFRRLLLPGMVQH
jgi:hypothetical protein